MIFNSIIIITYGRSGSTLLQGVLNTIDRCIIRGENYNFIYSLFQGYQALHNSTKKSLRDSPQNPWYGNAELDTDAYIKDCGLLIKRQLINNRDVDCYGFKEIRYSEITDDLEEYFHFLKQVFPNAAFIFNYRNLDDVVRSAWWKRSDPKKLKNQLKSLEKAFKSYQESNPDNCYNINYNDVVNKTEQLKGLFKFIGAEYNDEDITAVLSKPHSFKPASKKIKDLFNLDNKE